jgi:integrase
MSFEQWLIDKNYRPSTARKTVTALKAIRRDGLNGAPVEPLRRYAAYVRDQGAEGKFDKAVLALNLAPLRQLKEKPRRQQAARSFEPEDWSRLHVALWNDDSPEATVLLLQFSTGHRIGDILRVRKTDLSQAYRTGRLQLERKGGSFIEVPIKGAQRAWDRLHKQWRGDTAETVADLVAPDGTWGAEAGGAAYKRVSRHLKRICEDLGLEGRAHTHRLRRTVGVRALGRTKDVHAVQQLLGHRSIQSTLGYVDELREDDVAELQQGLLEDA